MNKSTNSGKKHHQDSLLWQFCQCSKTYTTKMDNVDLGYMLDTVAI